MSLSARRKVFRALHERGCFVIPNPWDVGSARYLQHLEFPALATTSAGFAFSQGCPTRATMLSSVAIETLLTSQALRPQSIFR
jgi:2-methylisocitrate lyase-like PEP mutase family enzyme